MKKIIPLVLVVALLAGGVVLLKKRKNAVAGVPVPIPITYTIRTVQPASRTITQTQNFLAKLEPIQRAEISTKLSGRIEMVLVKESQTVRKGDLLLQIDDQEIRASLSALQANLEASQTQNRYAQDQLTRNQAMFEVGGLPQERLDASAMARSAASAAVQGLEQQIQALKNQLGYSQITAPFEGTVGTIFLRAGNLALPGKPLLSLNVLPQKLTFRFAPDETGIQPGQAVLLQNERAGTVAKIYDDSQAGLSVAEVALDQRIEQPSGSYISIRVATQTATGCAVPIQSLIHRKQGTSLMLEKDGQFKEFSVSVLAQETEFAVVEPAVSQPVAVAAEAKLSLLPTARGIRVIEGDSNE